VSAVNHDLDIPSDELEFRFKGGDLALDFVATVGERWRANIERLRTPGDLDRWCREAGLGLPTRAAAACDLGHARDLRESIHRAVRSTMNGTDTQHADRKRINDWATKADIAPQLAPGDNIERVDPPSVAAVLATVARAAVWLIGGADADRLRECGAENCSTLFVDTSRACRRQWCSKRCADRVNAHRYRRRHQTATD